MLPGGKGTTFSMKQKRNNLFPVFLSTLMIALAFGALVLAAGTAMPRGGATLLLLIAAMGAAAAVVTGLKKIPLLLP